MIEIWSRRNRSLSGKVAVEVQHICVFPRTDNQLFVSLFSSLHNPNNGDDSDQSLFCVRSGYKDCCQLVLCIIITPSQLCLTRDRHKVPTPVLLNNQQLILWRIYQSTSLYQWWYHIPHSSFTLLWIVKCLIVRGAWCWYCWYWPQHCQHYQLQCWTDSLPEQRGSVGGQTEELGTRNININQKISYDIKHNEQIRSDLILILR